MIVRADPRGILHARAEALARPPVARRSAEGELQFVAFRLGAQFFGLPLEDAREVEPHLQITPVPCTPAWVHGLVNVRGEILVVLDLAALFGIPRELESTNARVIMVVAGDMTVGIVADEVLGTHSLAPDDLARPLPSSGGLRAEYVRGITTDGISVLDARQLFADERLLVRDQTES